MTMKSSQFQASLRWVNWDRANPRPITIKADSEISDSNPRRILTLS